jgi:hypothetical protein
MMWAMLSNAHITTGGGAGQVLTLQDLFERIQHIDNADYAYKVRFRWEVLKSCWEVLISCWVVLRACCPLSSTSVAI